MLLLVPDESPAKRPQRRRSLSPQWKGVLHLMDAEHPNGASYDDIHAITQRVGIDMKKDNLRGHMGNYKSSGYVKAVSPGVFILTGEGRKQAQPFEGASSAPVKVHEDGDGRARPQPLNVPRDRFAGGGFRRIEEDHEF